MDGRRSRSVSRSSRRLAGVQDREEEVVNKENPFKNSPDNTLAWTSSDTTPPWTSPSNKQTPTRNISTGKDHERNKHTV